MKLSWRDVLNTEHGPFGHITVAADIAHRAGYAYFAWNGRVYRVHHDGNGYEEFRVSGEDRAALVSEHVS